MFRHLIKRANAVLEALPYLTKFNGKTIVIKYGGAAMQSEELKQGVIQDVVLLKMCGMEPILVHGGGPEINKYLRKNGLEPKFIGGYRVTDKETMRIVQKVLGEKINQQIVSLIKKAGGKAKGFYGKKGRVIKAFKYWKKDENGNKIDLGFTGQVGGIRYRFLNKWMKLGYIPVLTSIGVGKHGGVYNINADKAAAAIAAYLKAEKLIMMTDVNGVLDNHGNDQKRRHFRRDDPEGQVVLIRSPQRGQDRAYYRRPPAARYSPRTFHRPRYRHDGPQVIAVIIKTARFTIT